MKKKKNRIPNYELLQLNCFVLLKVMSILLQNSWNWTSKMFFLLQLNYVLLFTMLKIKLKVDVCALCTYRNNNKNVDGFQCERVHWAKKKKKVCKTWLKFCILKLSLLWMICVVSTGLLRRMWCIQMSVKWI